MERRKFLFRSVQASALLLISGNMFASALPMFNPKKKKKVYFHYLLFWLRKDLSGPEVKEFENFFEGLKKLPYQKNLRYGKPAASSPRSVLDSTFTYNACMEFDSLEELEAYGKLPEHLALVQKYKPFFERMLVYDTVYN
ncbi:MULTISPECIES: Dabb family protein [unclassified Chryseobacterium]|uniref:Dabb family protein n=1 Tax=unclassified Chryseobacterium TaxID=2593645 RepID=UPI000E09E48D|nr:MULTISPECIES: Dabb family protein [unclassified Chryseobacterium]MDQ1857554.1 Dabb family protein [Chryseobacterium sp. WLY505]